MISSLSVTSVSNLDSAVSKMDPNPCTSRLLDQNFGLCISPEDMILPFYNFHGTNYFRPWKLLNEANKDFGSTIDSTKDKMKITLDVQHFRPNEISVKVNDREILIEGQHEERQDSHGFVSRQFTRRYTLPKDCHTETVTSTLSSDGVLTITANKSMNKEIKDNARVISIKLSGPAKTVEESKSGTCSEKSEDLKNESCAKIVAESKSESCPKKKEKFENIKEIEEKVQEADTASNKKDSQMMKEDHCRLLKSDLLSEAVSSTEKLLSESRKETDELLKLISLDTSAKATTSASEKLGEIFGECKSAMAELTEKPSEITMASSSEVSCSTNSMISESFESQETSSSISKSSLSMQSSMKSTSETMCEMICAELKEAAENL